MKRTEKVRSAIVDTLAYEIFLAPEPADPYWANMALNALKDAGLIEEEHIQEAVEWYRAARARAFHQAATPHSRDDVGE